MHTLTQSIQFLAAGGRVLVRGDDVGAVGHEAGGWPFFVHLRWDACYQANQRRRAAVWELWAMKRVGAALTKVQSKFMCDVFG